MNIFYINVIELNAKWGAEYFVNRGFIANGHQTFTLDYRKYRSFLAKKFLEMQEDFDVVFLQRGIISQQNSSKQLIVHVSFGQVSWFLVVVIMMHC